MFDGQLRRVGTLALALALALAGCKGDTGATGANGNDGTPGSSVGIITGAIQVSGGAGVPGAVVTTIPLNIASAPTGADGQFTISNVPIGTYTLSVSGPRITGITIPNVVVVAGTATPVGAQTVAFTPIDLTVAATPIPAGFGKAVPLSATVAGATGPVTYKWSRVSGPTAAAFDDATIATPTFTTATFEAMIAAGKLRNLTAPPARDGLLTITAQHVTNSTYNLKLEVSDGKYTQSKTFSIVTAVVSYGQNAGATALVPRNGIVVGNTGAVATGGWSLDKTGAPDSVAELQGANTKNPWFSPDAKGVYVLKNGTKVVSTITASDWYGAPSSGCAGACHNSNPVMKANVEAKFKEWSNSAHGNHFFKYFTYDVAGNLVPRADPAATTVVVPTATPGVNWTLTAPFRPITTFEFGITGGEGGHYSESCATCHTVGMNKALSNAGIDDVPGYALPNLGKDADPATPAPVTANWTALPQAMRDRAGMQCESCHGPVNYHATRGGLSKPTAFFDSGACAVCHDRGSNHNRFALWAESGHANLALAEEEGTSTDCGRCHSAQGFVEWARSGFDRNTKLAAAPSVTDVEPQTCVACHDPHTTTLRVDESQSITTTSGFAVSGAGVGQLCVICHSSRRGLHNDSVANTSYRLPHAAAQSDLFFGQNVFFFGPLIDGATISTHAFALKGTCGGCHLEIGEKGPDGKVPAEKALWYEGLTVAPTSTNHSFKVSTNLCAKCHEGGSLSGLRESTEGGIVDLKAAIADAARRSIPSVGGFRAGVPTVVPSISSSPCSLQARFTGVARPATIAVGMPEASGHGTGFTFTWGAEVQYTILASDNATVDCDSSTAGTQAITADIGPVTLAANAPLGVTLDERLVASDGTTVLVPANGDLFKSLWNMALIEEEGSLGAHNPGFTQRVLAVSKAKALAIPAAP